MKPISLRTDIASRIPYEKDKLLRLVLKDGRVVVDGEKNMPGRGCYLFPSEESLAKAIKNKAFIRAFHRPLTDEEVASIKERL